MNSLNLHQFQSLFQTKKNLHYCCHLSNSNYQEEHLHFDSFRLSSCNKFTFFTKNQVIHNIIHINILWKNKVFSLGILIYSFSFTRLLSRFPFRTWTFGDFSQLKFGTFIAFLSLRKKFISESLVMLTNLFTLRRWALSRVKLPKHFQQFVTNSLGDVYLSSMVIKS